MRTRRFRKIDSNLIYNYLTKTLWNIGIIEVVASYYGEKYEGTG